MSNRLNSHAGVNGRPSSQQLDELDPFPPPRISSLPPLESREAQDQFLSSPEAVVGSLGLRIPAALSQHIRRRSAPPPPPEATDELSGVQRMAALTTELPPPPPVPAEALETKPARGKTTRRRTKK